VTGPHQYEQVLDAVHLAVPPSPDPFIDLLPASGVRLTPRHYSYLKISEGCNHKCKFCIIPDMRGRLASRPAHAVIREAEKLVESGVRELLVISQDTSAYGVDIKHAEANGHRAHITDLARDLGSLGAWVRLHYVYPYPHVRDLIPLMAEGLVLPYLDIPFQHAHPDTLRRMARPAAAARTLDEIAAWRAICPDIALRSTFIVGFPGETEAEFQTLLDWLDEAQLDRVGCFKYEDVAGARSNALPDHLPEEIKQDRWDRFMERAQAISVDKLAAKVGSRQAVIVDDIDEDGVATCRTMADAPEIDGNLFIDEGTGALRVGDIVTVEVDEAADYARLRAITSVALPRVPRHDVVYQGDRIMRKFLVVLDDSRECLNAMRFAAMRAANTGGGVAILSVIAPEEFNHWIGVGDLMRQEARERIEAHFEVFAKWMRDKQGIDPELVIREGEAVPEIIAHVQDDPDIGVLVLGAASSKKGPGPLVTQLTRNAGTLPVPITIVPGDLSKERLEAIT
jgi:ribosomal protein S12 methylthiotransferase